MPPLASYFKLALLGLTGNDVLFNLVQWAFFAFSILAAAALAARLVPSGRAGPWAALLVATIPMAILQSTSTQNDVVVAGYLLAAAFFLSRAFAADGAPFRDLALGGAAVGLGLATKGTAYLLAVPLLGAAAGAALARIAFADGGGSAGRGPPGSGRRPPSSSSRTSASGRATRGPSAPPSAPPTKSSAPPRSSPSAPVRCPRSRSRRSCAPRSCSSASCASSRVRGRPSARPLLRVHRAARRRAWTSPRSRGRPLLPGGVFAAQPRGHGALDGHVSRPRGGDGHRARTARLSPAGAPCSSLSPRAGRPGSSSPSSSAGCRGTRGSSCRRSSSSPFRRPRSSRSASAASRAPPSRSSSSSRPFRRCSSTRAARSSASRAAGRSRSGCRRSSRHATPVDLRDLALGGLLPQPARPAGRGRGRDAGGVASLRAGRRRAARPGRRRVGVRALGRVRGASPPASGCARARRRRGNPRPAPS